MAELTEFHPVHNVMLRKLRSISPLADEDGEARKDDAGRKGTHDTKTQIRPAPGRFTSAAVS